MMTAYALFIQVNGTEWCYAGTAWTLQAAEEVLTTYATRYGWQGYYETEARR